MLGQKLQSLLSQNAILGPSFLLLRNILLKKFLFMKWRRCFKRQVSGPKKFNLIFLVIVDRVSVNICLVQNLLQNLCPLPLIKKEKFRSEA